MPDMVRIPLKGGTYKEIDLDLLQSDEFPAEVYKQLILDGLQVRLNARMSKISVKGLEGEELTDAQAAVEARAEENWQALCEGKIGRAKGVKVSGAVKARAMQKAMALAKDAIRREGYKIGAYTAAERKEMATAILESDPSLIDEAKRELEEQEAKGKEKKIALPEKFKREDAKAKPRGKPVAALAAAKKKRGEQATAQARH